MRNEFVEAVRGGPGEIERVQRLVSRALLDASQAVLQLSEAVDAASKNPSVRQLLGEVLDRVESAANDLNDLDEQVARMRSL